MSTLDKPIESLHRAEQDLLAIIRGINSGIYQVDPDLEPIARAVRSALQDLHMMRANTCHPR